MATRNYPLRIPESIMKEARLAAAQDGVSLNQFIGTARAEKGAALRTQAAVVGIAEIQAPGVVSDVEFVATKQHLAKQFANGDPTTDRAAVDQRVGDDQTSIGHGTELR